MSSFPIQTHRILPTKGLHDGKPMLICPFCENDNVSISGLEVVSPGRETGQVIIDSLGIMIDPGYPAYKRGSMVTLRCNCEGGHSWELEFHFDQGHTTSELFATDNEAMGPIWRD